MARRAARSCRRPTRRAPFYGARALPYDKNKMPYHRYEVLKPFPVKVGKAAWWFDEPGGAVQYKTEKTVQQLIDDGSLKEVAK